VKEGERVLDDPGGQKGLAVVPTGYDDAVTESSEECPGECIFIETYATESELSWPH
jgi:ferredoxin